MRVKFSARGIVRLTAVRLTAVRLTRRLTFALAAGAGMAQTRKEAPKIGDPPEAHEHAPRRLQRSAGAHRLSAHDRSSRAAATSPISATTAAAGEFAKPLNALTGQAELNGTSIVDVTDPKQPKYLAHIPGAVGDGEAGAAQMTRVCDGTQPRQGRSQQGLSAARVRARGPRDLGRDRPGQAQGAHPPAGDDGHPQELLGMRRRHRLSGLDAAGLAHPHDPGLRPERSGQSGQDPRLRAGRAAARRDRRGAGRRSTA